MIFINGFVTVKQSILKVKGHTKNIKAFFNFEYSIAKEISTLNRTNFCLFKYYIDISDDF